MRGSDRTSGSLFSYVDLDARVAQSHPLRTMRDLVNASLAAMDASFEALYKAEGRPSIPPERLLRASVAAFVFDPLGAPAGGAARVRSFVSLVRRDGNRR